MASKKGVKKCYGLLGRNIDYSFSRDYFSQKFKKEKLIHCTYQNFDLDSIDSVKSILEMDNISGLNVTTPYKREIIPYLDKISEQSKKIQAVNTIQFGKNGMKIGHNTDIFGFERSLLEITSKLPKNALILGTGGASSAVAFVLEKHKINVQNNFINNKTKKLYFEYDFIRKNNFPYVIGKLAISQNNRIFSDKTPISNIYSKDITHILRYRCQALLTSYVTINNDNPNLTCRLKGLEKYSPTIVIIDKDLKVKSSSKIFKNKDLKKIIFSKSNNKYKIKK